MKTKYEFRKKALDFAKRDEFKYDSVAVKGLYEDYEVYTPYCKAWKDNPPTIGLPQVILVNDREVKWGNFKNPFSILNACKKIPSIVFEYDCMCWFGNSYNLKLLDDGRLVCLAYGYSKLGPEDRMCDDKEYVLLNSPELVKEIKKLIKENKEDLKKIPREISNYNILDGAGETFRFGRMKFYGSNALTESMEGYQEKLKRYNSIPMGWEEELLQFQRIFKKFQDKFHEYFEYPLFNGEGREEE